MLSSIAVNLDNSLLDKLGSLVPKNSNKPQKSKRIINISIYSSINIKYTTNHAIFDFIIQNLSIKFIYKTKVCLLKIKSKSLLLESVNQKDILKIEDLYININKEDANIKTKLIKLNVTHSLALFIKNILNMMKKVGTQKNKGKKQDFSLKIRINHFLIGINPKYRSNRNTHTFSIRYINFYLNTKNKSGHYSINTIVDRNNRDFIIQGSKMMIKGVINNNNHKISTSNINLAMGKINKSEVALFKSISKLFKYLDSGNKSESNISLELISNKIEINLEKLLQIPVYIVVNELNIRKSDVLEISSNLLRIYSSFKVLKVQRISAKLIDNNLSIDLNSIKFTYNISFLQAIQEKLQKLKEMKVIKSNSRNKAKKQLNISANVHSISLKTISIENIPMYLINISEIKLNGSTFPLNLCISIDVLSAFQYPSLFPILKSIEINKKNLKCFLFIHIKQDCDNLIVAEVECFHNLFIHISNQNWLAYFLDQQYNFKKSASVDIPNPEVVYNLLFKRVNAIIENNNKEEIYRVRVQKLLINGSNQKYKNKNKQSGINLSQFTYFTH